MREEEKGIAASRWVLKPVDGRLSRGHKVVQGHDAVHEVARAMAESETAADAPRRGYVAQLCVEPPLTLDGRKFDLRVFVAVRRFAPSLEA